MDDELRQRDGAAVGVDGDAGLGQAIGGAAHRIGEDALLGDEPLALDAIGRRGLRQVERRSERLRQRLRLQPAERPLGREIAGGRRQDQIGALPFGVGKAERRKTDALIVFQRHGAADDDGEGFSGGNRPGEPDVEQLAIGVGGEIAADDAGGGSRT